MRDQIRLDDLHVMHAPGEHLVADMVTKVLPKTRLKKLRQLGAFCPRQVRASWMLDVSFCFDFWSGGRRNSPAGLYLQVQGPAVVVRFLSILFGESRRSVHMTPAQDDTHS